MAAKAEAKRSGSFAVSKSLVNIARKLIKSFETILMRMQKRVVSSSDTYFDVFSKNGCRQVNLLGEWAQVMEHFIMTA